MSTSRPATPSLLLCLTLPAFVLAADQPRPPQVAAGIATPSAEIVATVNGQEVTLEDLEQRLGALHAGASETTQAGFDLDRLMFQVVNDVLLGQEARALGMDQDPPIREKVEEYRDSILRRLVEREEIGRRGQPTEEEVRRVFDVEYQRITLRVVTAYDEEEARRLRQRLESGEDMEALAREASVDPYAQRGGLVQEVARADLQQDIAAVAFGLAAGELYGPVRTDIGWSVLRVLDKQAADASLFDGLKGICTRLARLEKTRKLQEDLSRDLAAHHQVAIQQEVVDAIVPEQGPDSRLMPRLPDGGALVAAVGSRRSITAGTYARALAKRWKGVRNVEAAAASAPIILQRLIHEELLVAEALRRGYHHQPEVQRAVEARETQLLVPRYLEQVVATGVEVSRAEMERYYSEHRGSFNQPPRLRLGQITVATLEEAQDVAAQLRAGTDLAWLARRKSIDRFRDSGGDAGWFEPRPAVDDFNDRLLEAAPGTVLDPLGVPGNFLVVKVLAREEQGPYSYDEVSGNVRDAVFAEKFQQALATFMNKLRSRAEIKIHDAVLEKLSISGRRTAAPGNGMGQDHGD